MHEGGHEGYCGNVISTDNYKLHPRSQWLTKLKERVTECKMRKLCTEKGVRHKLVEKRERKTQRVREGRVLK